MRVSVSLCQCVPCALTVLCACVRLTTSVCVAPQPTRPRLPHDDGDHPSSGPLDHSSLEHHRTSHLPAASSRTCLLSSAALFEPSVVQRTSHQHSAARHESRRVPLHTPHTSLLLRSSPLSPLSLCLPPHPLPPHDHHHHYYHLLLLLLLPFPCLPHLARPAPVPARPSLLLFPRHHLPLHHAHVLPTHHRHMHTPLLPPLPPPSLFLLHLLLLPLPLRPARGPRPVPHPPLLPSRVHLPRHHGGRRRGRPPPPRPLRRRSGLHRRGQPARGSRRPPRLRQPRAAHHGQAPHTTHHTATPHHPPHLPHPPPPPPCSTSPPPAPP